MTTVLSSEIERQNYSDLLGKLAKSQYDGAYPEEKIKERGYEVSVVIPTYNRCPFEDDRRNPLMWCISSIKQQEMVNVETIIVDDSSNDLTYKKLRKLEDEHLKYFRNEKRFGSSKSRNIGAELATKEKISFLDDDCIFLNKNALATASYCFEEIEKEGENIGALHLPVYYRSNRFKDVIPTKKILGIDYETAHTNCSTNSFPEERSKLKKEDYLANTNIIKPLKINNLAGAFICNRDAYLIVGGFPDFFPTPSLGEEHKMAQRFTENNYSIFLSPDQRTAVLHFKYGRKDKESVVPIVPLSRDKIDTPLPLEEMLKESRIERKDTGNAVTVDRAMYSYVFGRSMIFNGNGLSKEKFIERVKKNIIENNEYVYFTQRLNDRSLRERICLDAINDAEKMLGIKDVVPSVQPIVIGA